ncbi:zinc ribbon domain-containing protein [Halococcus thailandensis]|uniref:DUF7575 domain-containing protein n=1 Tax=Halococcus thailandensis JCM 13552 TaxID=1227457 RepID=M0N1M1_9EURY|nr:zinc ribbon domain-containing protein [Halococcus thailandensis]EMA50575.1 hypothetical protein C451_16450 [Halococcus thailandensis JCM 13552]
MNGHRSGKRPLLAAALALLYPGLGHLYLREWLRALTWFGLTFATVAIALPASAIPENGAGFSLDAVMQASEALPMEAEIAIFVLFVLNTVDAYRIARGSRTEQSTAADGKQRCPNCGRETDADLEFCQWCTEPLAADE